MQSSHKLSSRTKNNSINQWPNESNTQFPEEKIQMSNEYIRKCSISLARKEIQIKTMEYNLYLCLYLYLYLSIHHGILSSHNEKWNYVICRKKDGPRDHHFEWDKPSSKVQTYILAHVGNLALKWWLWQQ
jgi:hypothetical protein